MDSYGLESMRSCVPKGLIFSTFTNEDLRKLSVVKITTPLAFNALGHPLAGGLYDPALGSIDSLASCATCGLKQIKCFGHCGHIELPLPVLNPLYHKSVISLLKMCCLECHHVLVPHSMKCLLIGQLTLLHHGYIAEAQDLQNECLHLLRELATSDDDATRVTMTNFINTHIAKVISMSMSGPTVREFKGEAELRNQYIKEALSHVPKGKNCTECKAPLKKIEVINNKILIPQQKVEVAEKFSRKSLKKAQTISEIKEKGFTFLTPSECRIVLKNIFSIEGEFIKAIYPVLSDIAKASDPIDALFMDVVLVTPVNTRPVNFVRNVALEHPQNNVYKAILNECLVLKTIILMINGEGNQDLSEERKSVVNTIRGNTLQEKLQYSWENLQLQVDSLLDIEALKQRRTDGLGLKQIIEKKEGIIRMNMMGKRVNFAARTVITPDPNINVDEIGIPEIFARKLTYPVPVTTLNVDSLRRLVLNGPLIHPGANLLQNEDGSIIKLDENDLLQREGVAKKLLTPGFKKGVKILHRHLINGDVLLLNRQPTLHKPSIMAHKARILRGEKTFRLHYANCKAYNADFDGDEMNAHYPQNEVARSEGYNLAAVCRQYLVPKDGTPLGGLIQDHVVSGSRLTTRGRFFERSEYMNLVFQGLSDVNGDIKTLPPAIIKPSRLWSGKQIVSTVIVNLVPAGRTPLNLSSRAKIGRKAWGESYGSIMSEEDVIIREGELLCGVLDKMHYGSTPYSLVHCVYELYGGETACKLLSAFSKLFTAFLQSEGFTLSIKDILVVKSADKKRRKVIQTTRKIGDELVRSVLGDADESGNVRESLARALRKDPAFSAALDQKYKGALDSVTNDINGVCLPKGLVSPFPDNNLQLMVLSGAKGSTVNTMQISCLLGQILLEGKRPPLMLSGRALPSFLPFDTSPRAGGFVDGRFMTGIQPQEFFFHCMAGREGLIDTAVKTSRSGYLQRCLVKHLEGLTVGYDLTVRDSDGSVYQFLYGEDGMEVTKCQFLTKEQLPFLADNLQSIYDPTTVQQLKESSETDNVKSQKKAVKRWLHKHGGVLKAPKMSAFTVFSGDVAGSSSKKEIDQKTGRSHFCGKLLKKWKKLDPEEKKNYTKQARRPPDPVNSKFQPDRNFGSVCEKLDDIINNYLKTHKTSDETALRDSVYVKAMTSLSEPGEPVGLLAAQSVGEPSTQMTLNTFHFAGRGEINVTLGIPRLKEILMVASKNIKTPSMEVPFRTDVPKLDKRADKLRKRLTRVTMADVLETITVTEKIELSPVRRQVYILRLKFLPHEAYSDKFCVTPKKILKHVKNKFLKELLVAISTRGKKQRDLIETETEREGSGRAGDDDDDEGGAGDTEVGDGMRRRRKADVENEYQSSDEEPENEDDDATTARRRQRHNEEQQYSDLEDDVELLEEIEHVSKEAKEKKKSEEDEENDDGKQKELKDHSALEVQKTEIIDNYIIDTEKYEWCEVTLAYKVSNGRVDVAGKLKQIAALSIISQVSGIKKAFVNVKPNGEKVLTTEGQNLREMFFYEDLLDMNRLYVNDIHAVAQTYGIEAAAKVIVKEVRNVFQVYGISVDPRHLLLIADYMTYNGVYQPLSRKGMEGASSPLQQMSFESSSAFLKTSVLRSKRDDLLSPSARLMLGRPIGAGTSSFDLLHAIKAQ